MDLTRRMLTQEPSCRLILLSAENASSTQQLVTKVTMTRPWPRRQMTSTDSVSRKKSNRKLDHQKSDPLTVTRLFSNGSMALLSPWFNCVFFVLKKLHWHHCHCSVDMFWARMMPGVVSLMCIDWVDCQIAFSYCKCYVKNSILVSLQK